jgi:hypothetical protein
MIVFIGIIGPTDTDDRMMLLKAIIHLAVLAESPGPHEQPDGQLL